MTKDEAIDVVTTYIQNNNNQLVEALQVMITEIRQLRWGDVEVAD